MDDGKNRKGTILNVYLPPFNIEAMKAKNLLFIISCIVLAGLTAYFVDWFIFAASVRKYENHELFIQAYYEHLPAWLSSIVRSPFKFYVPAIVASLLCGLFFLREKKWRPLAVVAFLFSAMLLWSKM